MQPSTSQRVARHLRANVVGYLALFAALTLGPAWAATQTAPKDSVTSKSIKDGQVKTADVADNGLTGQDIDESTLTGVAGANGGTVTQINAGAGLSGGPITSTGTIGLNPCPTGQILKSTGSGYECASDADTNSGGTVTSVGSGAGLTGGPITGTGSLALQSCPNGQLLKSNGAGYACGVDANSGGDITDVIAGNGLLGGSSSGAATLNMPNCAQSSILRSAGFGNGYQCASMTLDTSSSSGTTLNACCGAVVRIALNYASPTTITGLTGVPGQLVTLVAISSNLTITDGGNFFLAGNWNPDNSDSLTLIAGGAGNDWTEVARSAN